MAFWNYVCLFLSSDTIQFCSTEHRDKLQQQYPRGPKKTALDSSQQTKKKRCLKHIYLHIFHIWYNFLIHICIHIFTEVQFKLLYKIKGFFFFYLQVLPSVKISSLYWADHTLDHTFKAKISDFQNIHLLPLQQNQLNFTLKKDTTAGKSTVGFK